MSTLATAQPDVRDSCACSWAVTAPWRMSTRCLARFASRRLEPRTRRTPSLADMRKRGARDRSMSCRSVGGMAIRDEEPAVRVGHTCPAPPIRATGVTEKLRGKSERVPAARTAVAGAWSPARIVAAPLQRVQSEEEMHECDGARARRRAEAADRQAGGVDPGRRLRADPHDDADVCVRASTRWRRPSPPRTPPWWQATGSGHRRSTISRTSGLWQCGGPPPRSLSRTRGSPPENFRVSASARPARWLGGGRGRLVVHPASRRAARSRRERCSCVVVPVAAGSCGGRARRHRRAQLQAKAEAYLAPAPPPSSAPAASGCRPRCAAARRSPRSSPASARRERT